MEKKIGVFVNPKHPLDNGGPGDLESPGPAHQTNRNSGPVQRVFAPGGLNWDGSGVAPKYGFKRGEFREGDEGGGGGGGERYVGEKGGGEEEEEEEPPIEIQGPF